MARFLRCLIYFICSSTLLVNGQCTVLTFGGSESDENLIRSLEEHVIKLRILGEKLLSTFGKLEVNDSRIIVRCFKENDENLVATLKNLSQASEIGDKILLQELEKHTQIVKNIFHNTSMKLERIGERTQERTPDECLRLEENTQFLLEMILNWSSKVEKIDESIEDVNKTLDRKLKEPNQRLISLYQNLSSNIDTKFDFMQNAISKKLEEHEKEVLELIDQNLSSKLKSTNESLLRVLENDEKIQQMYERLSSRLQSMNESMVRSFRDTELKLQTIHENFTAVIDQVNVKLNVVLDLANETIQNVKSNGEQRNNSIAIVSSEENLALSTTATQSDGTTTAALPPVSSAHVSATQSTTDDNHFTSRAVDGTTTTELPSVSSARACNAIVSSEVNLALNRTATQSSTYFSNDASRAVDGNAASDFSSGSCAHVNDGPGEPNWWRVKLDRPYRVQKVTVTNRGDCCGARLDYFIVGVTNSTADPVRGAYPLCGQYPSTVASGATVTLNCDRCISAGQYVIIQPSNGLGWLTLCEVEVYGGTAIVSSEAIMAFSTSATQSTTDDNHFTSRAVDGTTTTELPPVSSARACNAIVSSEVNLALSRPATQSSTLWNYYASRAVDGNSQTSFGQSSCSHTDDDPGEPNWWRVQLDRPYRVRKVTVTNRGDCCANRLDYFIVGVTNSTADPVRGAYPLCGQYPSEVALGATVTLNCDLCISAGQYVIIQQPSNGTGSLTLCEVEVYGGTAIVPSKKNLAFNCSATQSSTYCVNVASRAVDGNTAPDLPSGSCAHVNDGPGGPNWWRVKLDRPYRVRSVTVTNRGDCCEARLDYFIVGVTNSVADPVRGAYPLCGQYPSTVAPGATVTLNCNPRIGAGQYVIIQQPVDGEGYLTLCEVEVYGETACPDGFEYMPDIDQCLYLNLNPMTWDNARNACASFKTGAQLVSIKDSAKQESVKGYLQRQFTKLRRTDCVHSYWNVKLAWIGGQRQNPNRCDTPFVWKYNRGSDIPFTFTKWASGQPDCNGNNEHSVHIMNVSDYSWNDAASAESLCSVCEI